MSKLSYKPELNLEMEGFTIETTDYFDNWNAVHRQLLGNDAALDQRTKELSKEASEKSAGLLSAEDKKKLDAIETEANKYELPVAGSELGGVKSGTDISVDQEGNVSVNDNSHNHVIANVDGLDEALAAKVPIKRRINNKELSADVNLSADDVAAIPISKKGIANGVAELDDTGKVPAVQLPSYVDDVIEGYLFNGKFYNELSHTTEIPRESGKIYIDLETGKTYRWSGSTFGVISETLALGITGSTAFRGDYGNKAYEHALKKGKAFASGIYKITTNEEGHVIDAEKVTKEDITELGIPGQNTDTTYKEATQSVAGLMSTTDKKKLDGIDDGANKYMHPAYTARKSGLYKITVDETGHVQEVVAVTKQDIVDLGIPGQDTNTTYTNMGGANASAAGRAGLVPAPEKGADNRYLRSDGTWQVPPDNNTTYVAMRGASSSAAGAAGLVPQPVAGKQKAFLQGDGTWADTRDTANDTATFTSGDNTNLTEWTDVALLASGEKHNSILNKISTMFRNLRYIWKLMGTADISGIGDGTIRGALNSLNSSLTTKNAIRSRNGLNNISFGWEPLQSGDNYYLTIYVDSTRVASIKQGSILPS